MKHFITALGLLTSLTAYADEVHSAKWACFAYCRVVDLEDVSNSQCMGPRKTTGIFQLTSTSSSRLGAYDSLKSQCKAQLEMCNKGQIYQTEAGARRLKNSNIATPETSCFPN